jgi:hypothetical protein
MPRWRVDIIRKRAEHLVLRRAGAINRNLVGLALMIISVLRISSSVARATANRSAELRRIAS